MGIIKESTYLDYIFLFGDNRTAYMDYAVKNAVETKGKLLILYEDIYPIGLMCCSLENDCFRITYAFTYKQYRNKGVFTMLMSYMKDNSPLPIKVSIPQDHKYYNYINPVLYKMGFQLQSSCIVYGCEPKDYGKWALYMNEKGNKLNDMLKRKGFECISFHEASQKILDEIYHSSESDFDNPLPVQPFFDYQSRCMDRCMSFVAVKDGHLAAYSLVSRPGKNSAVFEQTAVSEKYRGTGIILLPFSESMNSVATFHCTKASYAIYENNIHSNAFRKKIVDRVTSSKRRSENYIYRKEEY